MANDIDFSKKVNLKSTVLQRKLEDNLVFCNLDNESFYKLDPFSRKIFETVLNCSSINEAYQNLIRQYDVDSDILKEDLGNLLKNLVSENIVNLS